VSEESLLEIAAVASQRKIKLRFVHHVVSICKSISVEDASDMPNIKLRRPLLGR
jgi:hypothetical protein